MLGARFLDVDFMRINFACGLRDCLAYTPCLHSRKGRSGRMHRDRWRHRSGREHGGAGREANLIFVLPPNVYVAPPVGGTFWFQIFIQAPSLEIWRKTISD